MRMPLALLAAALMSSAALAQQSQRADLCAELSDFVSRQSQQKPAEGAPPPQQATAVQAPAKDEQRVRPGGSDAAQQTSGLSGPVTPGGTGATGPQGLAQETAPSAQDNPKAAAQAPPAAAQAPPPQPEALVAAQAAIDQKDVLACRDVAQKMRRAGVNLPAPLLALAAVDPRFLKPENGAGATGASP